MVIFVQSFTAHDEPCPLSCVERNVSRETHQHTPADTVSHSDETLCYLAALTSATTTLLEWISYFPVVEIASGHRTIRPMPVGCCDFILADSVSCPDRLSCRACCLENISGDCYNSRTSFFVHGTRSQHILASSLTKKKPYSLEP